MKFSAASAAEIRTGYFPVVANGFLGLETGPFVQPFHDSWPWLDAGLMGLNGVYSGTLAHSHRAQIPKLSDLSLVPESLASYAPVGCAIDFSTGVFYNRTRVVSGAAQCPGGTIIEQRTYAHRRYRELIVFEVRAFEEASGAGANCTVPVAWKVSPTATPAAPHSGTALDVNLTQTAQGGGSAPTVWSGTTSFAEQKNGPVRSLAVAFSSIAASSTQQLRFDSTRPVTSVFGVHRSDLDVQPTGGTAASPQQVAAAAAATFREYTADGRNASATLFASHTAEMKRLWASGGVELEGNSSFAATVNASLYDLVSSLRADWNWSASPGGLGTGGYGGWTFWDMETWMFPSLIVLFPDIARAAAQYRIDRVAASETNARLAGYEGAMWAWQSATTGLPFRASRDDKHEDHISADIPLAHRKYFLATGDMQFLRDDWPLLNATCKFWECRFGRVDSTNGPPPPGYAKGCAAKDGRGNWTVLNVVSPDESAGRPGTVNNSAYTNAAAAQALSWCVEAAGLLGVGASMPQLWSEIASSPYLPLTSVLFDGGPVHLQDATYTKGTPVNQAAVALLQYPLGLDFGPSINRNDLDYYASVTKFEGMFTGDASYSCAYLALGNRSIADSMLELAFSHINPHFNVFHETAGGGTQHFVTGSGGYIQGFMFGYSGMRIARKGVLSFSSQQPVLPPLGVTSVTLRGVHLLGTAFNFQYNASAICVGLTPQQPVGHALELIVLDGSTASPVLITESSVCVALGPVEIVGRGAV